MVVVQRWRCFLDHFSVAYIFFIYTHMQMLKSLIIRSEVIEYSGKVIICMGGTPMLIWMFFLALRMLLKKGVGKIETKTVIGTVWGIFSVGAFLVGIIASFIIPFILMASPYTSCNVGKYSSYYVINPDLCKTIVPDHWPKK